MRTDKPDDLTVQTHLYTVACCSLIFNRLKCTVRAYIQKVLISYLQTAIYSLHVNRSGRANLNN
jgi:hypothetical protein